jgi:hypothetical protein
MSPTFEVRASFAREFARLSREQDRAFRQAVGKLVDALAEAEKLGLLGSELLLR